MIRGIQKILAVTWIATCILLVPIGLGGQSTEEELTPALPEPLTLTGRLDWAARSSVSPKRFAGHVVSSALGTLSNAPEEYGPHWEGFGKRLGLRASVGATGAFLEAGVGAIWREEPRFARLGEGRVRGRVWNALKQTVMAYHPDGTIHPAYGRMIAFTSNSILSNQWRPDSHVSARRTISRIELAFLSKAGSNLFSEFWPDIRRKLLHKK